MTGGPNPAEMGPNHRPRVSILIPNWNGMRFLPECLAALEAQTFRDFEVIVADNGSTDGSLEYLGTEHPGVRVLELGRNLGFARAMNRAIRESRGEILVFLNNDTRADPGWLEALVRGLDAHREAGMATSKMLLAGQPDRLHSTGDTYSLAGLPGSRGVWEMDRGQHDERPWVFGLQGGAGAIRRRVLEEIGGLEERLGSYCEDVELSFRAQLAGYPCLYVPEARIYHHLSATGGGPLASFFVGRNVIWVAAKLYPLPLLLKHLPRLVGAQLGIAAAALRAWRGAAARARLRGQLAGCLGLPWVLLWRLSNRAPRRLRPKDVEALLIGAESGWAEPPLPPHGRAEAPFPGGRR